MVNKLLYKPSVRDIMDKYYEKNSGNKKDFFNSPDIPDHSLTLNIDEIPRNLCGPYLHTQIHVYLTTNLNKWETV